MEINSDLWVVSDLLNLFKRNKFTLEDEKTLQAQIALKLNTNGFPYLREFHLDEKNIPDFIVNENIVIEVKLKGTATQIYYQCERYCKFDEVRALILVTNKSMTLPTSINGKLSFVVNISESWL
jgi:hypothetical protein